MTTATAETTATVQTLQEQVAQMAQAMQVLIANQPTVIKLPTRKPKAEVRRPRIGVKQTPTNRGMVIRVSTGATAISKAGKDYNAFLDIPLHQLVALEAFVNDKDVIGAVKRYLKTGVEVAID